MTLQQVRDAFPDIDLEARMAAAAERITAERARRADATHRAAS